MNESTQEKEEKGKSATSDRQKDSKSKKVVTRRNLLSTASSLIAGIAAAASIGVGVNIFSDQMLDRPTKVTFSILREIDQFENRLAKQENTMKEILKKLDILSKVDNSTDIGVQVASIRSDLEASNTRVKILEDGLLENPQKALSVPLLRNDLNNLKQNYKEDISSMVKSIDRVYDQNKWFIGLMFTMAIGLIGLAVSNFIQSRKKPED